MQTRRSFLAVLATLPIVSLFAKAAPTPQELELSACLNLPERAIEMYRESTVLAARAEACKILGGDHAGELRWMYPRSHY